MREGVALSELLVSTGWQLMAALDQMIRERSSTSDRPAGAGNPTVAESSFVSIGNR